MRQPLTREAISRAARDILVAEGLHSVSLRRVASSLGVTAPALYAHVVDKRDLLQGIVEREIETMLERFRTVSSTDPVGRIEEMAQAYVDYGLQNPDLFRAMFLFRPELTAEPGADRPALGSQICDSFVEAVRKAQRSGTFADADAQLAALTIWTTAHGVVTTLLSGPPLDIDLKNKLCDVAIKASINGLRNGSLQAA